MSDGQESQTLHQLTLLIEKMLPNHCKSKNNLRTFQAENLKIEEYLRTASFKSILLVLIKKECKRNKLDSIIEAGPDGVKNYSRFKYTCG